MDSLCPQIQVRGIWLFVHPSSFPVVFNVIGEMGGILWMGIGQLQSLYLHGRLMTYFCTPTGFKSLKNHYASILNVEVAAYYEQLCPYTLHYVITEKTTPECHHHNGNVVG
jgi:hypothetical protein